MRGSNLALAAAAIVLAAAAASAGTGRPGPETASDNADVIAGRKAAMRMSGAIVGALKVAVDRGDDVKGQAFPARALASWAKAIPGMFPAGSDGAPSDALPAIWSDRAGFQAKADAYAAAATRLADAAKAGDQPGFAAALGDVRASCGGCHDGYKKPDPPRP